jgi:hypothetical protein
MNDNDNGFDAMAMVEGAERERRARALARQEAETQRSKPLLRAINVAGERFGRLLGGAAFVAAGVWSCTATPSISDTPLAALTLGQIAGFLFFGGLAFVLVIIGVSLAFSTGRTIEQEAESLLPWAREQLKAQDRDAAANARAEEVRESATDIGRRVGQLLRRK